MSLLIAIISTLVGACSLAVVHSYFHQVTAIRGEVVGRSLGPLQFRWLRQSFRVVGANLALYEYRWPAKQTDLKLVASIKTDPHGNFDFGPIARGHYVLEIRGSDPDLRGEFDVEVTDAVKATDRITIDVSPIQPDCTGGHEFIESKKS
ncbi:MAG: hypothetical protein WBM24_03935 [Candidatus Sulfotelmatobacter sp.]